MTFLLLIPSLVHCLLILSNFIGNISILIVTMLQKSYKIGDLDIYAVSMFNQLHAFMCIYHELYYL